MPPKVKVTKEEIIAAALEILRQKGMEAVNARAVAAALGCSTQPIFSNYSSMGALQHDVLAAHIRHVARQVRDHAVRVRAEFVDAHPAAGRAQVREIVVVQAVRGLDERDLMAARGVIGCERAAAVACAENGNVHSVSSILRPKRRSVSGRRLLSSAAAGVNVSSPKRTPRGVRYRSTRTKSKGLLRRSAMANASSSPAGFGREKPSYAASESRLKRRSLKSRSKN